MEVKFSAVTVPLSAQGRRNSALSVPRIDKMKQNKTKQNKIKIK
jgi:hypothetical protein